MVPLVRAMAGLDAAGLGRYVVVGGVAVAIRLGRAHRATSDVDTVVDDSLPPPSAVEALLALPGATPDPDAASRRVYLEGTKIELLGVGPVEPGALAGVPELDALFVASHNWALETAALVTVVAGDDPSTASTVPVATPAALVAMKLHAIQTRTAGASKRAADAWDIHRILVDLDGGGVVRTALATAPEHLRTLVAVSAERILDSNAARTRSWLVQGGDDLMASVSAEELRLAAAPLVDALR